MEILKTHRNGNMARLAVLIGLYIGIVGGVGGSVQQAFAFAKCPEGQRFGCVHYNGDPHQPFYCNCFPNQVAVIPAFLPETQSENLKGGFFDSEKYKQCMKTCIQTTHYGDAVCDIRCGGW